MIASFLLLPGVPPYHLQLPLQVELCVKTKHTDSCVPMTEGFSQGIDSPNVTEINEYLTSLFLEYFKCFPPLLPKPDSSPPRYIPLYMTLESP